MRYFLLMMGLFQSIAFTQDMESKVTANFSDVKNTAQSVLQTHSANKVLFVFDIDNTILKTQSDLGSEHWYLWQKDLIDKGVKALPAIASSGSDLLMVQSVMYSLSKMVPTTPELPAFVKEMRDLGAEAIALTSRGMAVRDVTLREMESNKIPLSDAKSLKLKSSDGPYLPYSLDLLEESGLTTNDVTQLKLGTPRMAYFERGAFMTDGQHKGAMLVTLLHRMRRTFDAIVFVDDRAHHIQGMRDAFKDRTEKLYSIQYTVGTQWTEPFNASDKKKVQEEWCSLSHAIKNGGFAENHFRLCP